jgi:membrane protease YdiL (CAAX protease family)
MRLKSKSLAVKTNYLVLAVVAFYLVTQLAAQLTLGQSRLSENLYLFLLGIQVFIILIPAALFLYVHKLSPVPFLRICGLSVPEALLIVLMSVTSSFVASVLNAFVVFLLEKAGPVKTEGIPPPENVNELWLQIFVIAILPAICEEFFFRGIIFRSFESLGTGMAMGVSAVYFALFHFDLRNLAGPLFLGFLITWYCYRSGSIFAAVLAHFINNLMAVLTGWFGRADAEAPMLLTQDALGQMFSFACFAGIVLIILVKAFDGITRKKVKKNLPEAQRFPLSVILHWPVCLFVCTYVIIGIMFISSLRPQ